MRTFEKYKIIHNIICSDLPEDAAKLLIHTLLRKGTPEQDLRKLAREVSWDFAQASAAAHKLHQNGLARFQWRTNQIEIAPSNQLLDAFQGIGEDR